MTDTSGVLEPTAYRAMADNMSKDAGIDYRYGPASTVADSGLPTYSQRTDNPFCDPMGACVNPSSPNWRGYWQVGGPTGGAGPYFSNMANVLFVANNPAANRGVSVFQQLAVAHNALFQLPQLSWVYPDGLEDPNSRARGASSPVAIGRCQGRGGWCVNGIVAFQNGVVGTARGSNTALGLSNSYVGQTQVQLGANLVPTAVAVTNSAEFALVSVWDKTNVRGRIAVIALTGMCNGCSLNNYGDEYWGDWIEPYPGLQNLGNIGFMKLLGYVELPDMKAPTEIVATTGWNHIAGITQPADRNLLTLTNESNRQTFMDGGINQNGYAKTGLAVVVSKSERKATFIDLRPLFAYYKKMYFGSQSNFAQTRNVGGSAGQWPFTFSEASEQLPTVIKTIGLDNPPTAVKATQEDPNNPRAWIATQEGQLHFYSLGNYLKAAGGGAAAEIQRVGGITVGGNVTGMTYSRGPGTGANGSLILVSRSQRKIQWVDLASNGNSGTVRSSELLDTRMKDPISVDDNGTNGSQVGVVTVADYRAGILNYRYSTLYLNPGYTACQSASGGCPTQGGPYEFGGVLQVNGLSGGFPGKTFAVSGANVP